jgi:hypothetical protein
MRNKKISSEMTIMSIGIGLGLLSSWLITIGGSAIYAWLLVTEKIGEGSIGLLAAILIILASAMGALTGTLCIKKNKLSICLICGCGYYLTLLGVTTLTFGAQYQNLGIGAVGVIAGCVPIAFLPLSKGRVGKWRKKVFR